MTLNILIIDDDKTDRMAIKRSMDKLEEDIIFFEADTGTLGIQKIREKMFDGVFLDYRLPDMDGTDVLKKMYSEHNDFLPFPMIMVTGQGNERVMIEALKYGAHDYLVKDNISVDTLDVAFTKARQIYDLRKAEKNTQNKLEKLVEERTAELNKANETKDMFLANMSHELRTPLNSIIGLIRILMQEKDISNDHIRTLNIVEKSATSLLEIVNDILDISKIEAGKIELENRPFNVSGLMFSVLDQLRPLASRKGIELKSNEAELPIMNVMGDEFRLSRILMNLASNAIKYTNDGYVEVITTIEDVDDKHVRYQCMVSDTGIGIPEDKIDSIFDKFTQAEESTERRFGGTGLGLNITKHLTNLMGGEITVESEYGKGSSFTVSITFKKSSVKGKVRQKSPIKEASQKRKGHKRISVHEAKILVAEDHEFNQIFVMKLLRRVGLKSFDLASDGKEAFNAYKKEKYDLILMDCHMPEMNGYEVTRAIREDEQDKESDHYGTYTPIVAMTADAMVGTKEACLEAGMDDYISKPIMEEEFKALVSEWCVLDIMKDEAFDDGSGVTSKTPANLSMLREYADNDDDIEKELLSVFYKKSLKDMSALEENAKGGKNEAWAEAAHSLKGSAGYIGAAKLHDLCAKAQDMLHATGRERRDAFCDIQDEYQNVCSFLKGLK